MARYSAGFAFSTIMFASLSAPAFAAGGPKAGAIDVMFYNVHNLFDAVHDEGKDDWTFLPRGFPGKAAYCETVTVPAYREECERSDWTEAHVALKLGQIKTAVTTERDHLPEILGLSEVENENVVGMLANKLGYENFAMTNSPDARGIDVALLYKASNKLKFVQKREHAVTGPEVRATRNILEVEFDVANNKKLFVFVNHWPSQASPSPSRIAAAKVMSDAIDDIMRKEPGAHVIATGDFNTIDTDYPHPFREVTQSANRTNPMIDLREQFQAAKNIPLNEKKKMPLGTYFFPRGMQWNNLDRLFVSRNLLDQKGVEAELRSFSIHSPELLQTTFTYEDQNTFAYGTTVAHAPKTYNIYTTRADEAGFSDHFPVVVTVSIP